MRSRRLCYLAAALPFAAGAVCFAGTPDEAARHAPSIFCVGPEHDFGRIDRGQVVRHSYRIENRGGSVLHIHKVRTSCGCTTATPAPMAIEPGKELLLEVVYNSAGKSGPQTQAVFLDSDDPVCPTFHLTLKTDVMTRLRIEPPEVDLGDVRLFAEKTAQVIITPLAGSRPRVVLAQSFKPYLTAALLSSDPSGGAVTVGLRLTSAAPPGELRESVVLSTDDPGDSVYRLPVKARVVGDVEVIPERLELGLLGAEDLDREWHLVLKTAGGAKIGGILAVSQKAFLYVRVLEVAPGSEYRLIVRLAPGAVKDGPFEDLIEVRMTGTSLAALRIPVLGRRGEKPASFDTSCEGEDECK